MACSTSTQWKTVNKKWPLSPLQPPTINKDTLFSPIRRTVTRRRGTPYEVYVARFLNYLEV